MHTLRDMAPNNLVRENQKAEKSERIKRRVQTPTAAERDAKAKTNGNRTRDQHQIPQRPRIKIFPGSRYAQAGEDYNGGGIASIPPQTPLFSSLRPPGSASANDPTNNRSLLDFAGLRPGVLKAFLIGHHFPGVRCIPPIGSDISGGVSPATPQGNRRLFITRAHLVTPHPGVKHF